DGKQTADEGDERNGESQQNAAERGIAAPLP
ncbi:MAG: hypothetical protein QOG38_2423, partial [Hyphomicrobiales bacterium]|nr:hypothetical protein [Hyphomicrobiales bacterium]